MDLLSSPLFVVTAVVAVSLLGLSKGGFLGVGVMATPLLTLVVPPLQAAAIVLPSVMAQDIVTLWAYRRHWDAWNVKVLMPGLALGVGVAWLLATWLTAAHVRLAIGIIALAFVLRHWVGERLERLMPRPSVWTGWLFGLLAGITTTFANSGGPALQMHLLPQRLDKLTFVGTVALLFAASNVFKLPAYAALGQFTAPTVIAGLALLPVAIAANFVGIWLVRRVPTEMFYRIIYGLMFAISLELIRGGLTEILRG